MSADLIARLRDRCNMRHGTSQPTTACPECVAADTLEAQAKLRTENEMRLERRYDSDAAVITSTVHSPDRPEGESEASEASALLPSDVTGAAFDLIEAIKNAAVESQGGVGAAMEKLDSVLDGYRTAPEPTL